MTDQQLLEQGTGTEAIDHLDEDWVIACECHLSTTTGEPTQQACGHVAGWWLVCRHCRDTTAFCSPHMTLWARLVPVLGAACDRCGAAVCGAHASSLFKAIPIGARP